MGTWTSVVEITAMYAICSNTHTDLKPLYWPQNVQSQELLLLYGTDEFWLQNQQLTVIDIFDLNTQRQQKLLSADDVGQLMYDYHKANIFYSCDARPACNKHDVRYSTVSIHPSVTSRSSIESWNRKTDWAGFGTEIFHWPILHCILKKLRHFQKQGNYLLQLQLYPYIWIHHGT